MSLSAQDLTVKAGHLIDPETGTATADQTIHIEKGRITAVGADLPVAGELVDLSEAVVLPGLFDAHTHLCASIKVARDHGDFLTVSLLDPTAYRAIQGVVHAREMLAAGFTTVRDLGNAGNYADIDLARAVNEGLVPGPTILPAGRIIAPFGGQFRQRAENAILDNAEYFFADSRDELRKAVRANVHYGAKVIKLLVDGQKYSYTTDDIAFVVAEARRAGLKVAAHVQTERGAREAVAAGVASIEHGWYLDDATLAMAREKGVVLVSTDFTARVLEAFGWDAASAKRKHRARMDRLKRAYDAGVTVAFGTDVMVPVRGETRGSLAISYIDSFTGAGVPPADILRALTVNAARLLGVEEERGLLKPGYRADLIAVQTNPLQDIDTLKDVILVMKGGQVFQDRR